MLASLLASRPQLADRQNQWLCAARIATPSSMRATFAKRIAAVKSCKLLSANKKPEELQKLYQRFAIRY